MRGRNGWCGDPPEGAVATRPPKPAWARLHRWPAVGWCEGRGMLRGQAQRGRQMCPGTTVPCRAYILQGKGVGGCVCGSIGRGVRTPAWPPRRSPALGLPDSCTHCGPHSPAPAQRGTQPWGT